MGLYNKILLAVDFASHTEALCEHAAVLAKAHGAELSVIHVVEPVVTDSAFDTLPPLPVDFDDVLVEQARKRLEQIRDQYGLSPDNVFLEIGVTKKEIIRVAAAQQTDLIIVGSHGRHGVELLLGSTANAILHHAPCDVLAYRIKPQQP